MICGVIVPSEFSSAWLSRVESRDPTSPPTTSIEVALSQLLSFQTKHFPDSVPTFRCMDLGCQNSLISHNHCYAHSIMRQLYMLACFESSRAVMPVERECDCLILVLLHVHRDYLWRKSSVGHLVFLIQPRSLGSVTMLYDIRSVPCRGCTDYRCQQPFGLSIGFLEHREKLRTPFPLCCISRSLQPMTLLLDDTPIWIKVASTSYRLPVVPPSGLVIWHVTGCTSTHACKDTET